ncbi:MAG: ribbon-helix-helix domain-containing protein [Opitutaceae bacterium]|jgi:antitoxin component of RelBE/YafQ-DinJ toxin-antitoxin module|nr:ribbon-helix-helix domain-containing protein [Opitutaceae bacterium]
MKKSGYIHIRVEDEIPEQLERIAQRSGVSSSQLARLALKTFIANAATTGTFTVHLDSTTTQTRTETKPAPKRTEEIINDGVPFRKGERAHEPVEQSTGGHSPKSRAARVRKTA